MSGTIKPDLSLAEVRRALPRGQTRYIAKIARGRALVYRKPKTVPPNWAARLCMVDGAYKLIKLAPALDGLDSPPEAIDYSTALTRAKDWWQRPEQRKIGVEERPLGPKLSLVTCPIGADYSVTHALQDYVDWVCWFRSKTYLRNCVKAANGHILPLLGNQLVSDLTRQNLVAFAQTVEKNLQTRSRKRSGDKPLSDAARADALRGHRSTVNHIYGILHSALEQAFEDGKVQDCRAWHKLKRFSVPSRQDSRTVPIDQCRRAVQAAGPELRNLLLASLYTGCRFSELQIIRAVHVQHHRQALYVPARKTTQDRFVTLSKEAYEFFHQLKTSAKNPDEILLRPRSGALWHSRTAAHQLRQLRREHHLTEKLQFHALRHTHASRLIAAGAHPISVARQMGHTRVRTVLQTYTHCVDEPIHEQKLREIRIPEIETAI